MKIKLLLLFVLITSNSISQGVNNLWLMGYECCVPNFSGMNIDFSSGSFNLSMVNRGMSINCTNGQISDSSGNILFYSNGIYVANMLDDTMMNGSGLNPGVFTTQRTDHGLTIPQANLVLPVPGEINKYYLFHETCDDYGLSYATFYLYYSIIDMSLDGGLGAVTQKNSVLLQDTLVDGRLTATKHANGRDWWLFAHKDFSSLMFKFLITPNGIQGPFVQDLITYRGHDFGQTVFSQDGSKFAYYETVNDLDIWDFDRCTGEFSNLIHITINDSMPTGGCAFSPSGRFLYVSSTNYLYQFDTQASNVPASQTTVGIYDGTVSGFQANFYLSQLAPDGKIYINCANGTKVMHVINSPDSLGSACDFCQHCIALPAYNAFTIPNSPNYFLGAESGTMCDSLTNDVTHIRQQKQLPYLFPNPAKDILYVSGIEGKLLAADLINSVGVIVKPPTEFINSNEYLKVDISELATGIYVLRLSESGRVSNLKFFKY